MKKSYLIPTLILSLLSTVLTHASFAEASETRGKERESRMLMHLLKMNDSELTKLRQTVERIEAMSPDERAKMRERLGKLQNMNPQRRQALRERFEALPKEKREAMQQRWMEMEPKERREWRQKLKAMSPEERADAMEAAGFIPMRPKKHHGEKQANPSLQREGAPPKLEN